MGFCRSAVCVLILLLYLHRAVSDAAPDEKTVRVFLHDSAVLPCSGSPCTGTVTWLNLQNSSVVAWCDRTSCNSTEGFQMSHHQYLKGNFSLSITAVNPSNAGPYGCQCGHTPLQEVRLQIESADTVKVGFDGTAVLPCSVRCPGVARWTSYSDILAECDQTSCRSVKEGYHMIYNQYLLGDLFLIITEADYSKRGWYTCDCDGIYLCHDRLQINPLKTEVQIKPGDSLVMELEISDPVEVIYQENANQTGRQVCTVKERSSQVPPPYTLRTSLAVELRGVKESDSGVYTIRDVQDEEDIHIYNVTVQEEHHSGGDKEDWVPALWFWLIVALCIVFFIAAVVLSAVVVCMCKNGKHPCKERLCLQRIRSAASEEISQTTEQETLTPTDDLDK